MANEEQLQSAYDQGFQAARVANEEYENKVMVKEFKKMRMELRSNGAANHITTFNGEGPEKFQKWLKEIERTRAAVSADDDRSRAFALQTLSGSAADYVTRLIQDNENITWEDLKDKLSEHYNDLADVQYARQQLRRLAQRPEESIQNYYERIMLTASNAFGPSEMSDKHVETQLIDFFIDGLRDDGLVRRLLRKSPKTLADAFKLATNEQQAQRSYDLRRGRAEVEPMEIDAMSSSRNVMPNLSYPISAHFHVLVSDIQQLRHEMTQGIEKINQRLPAELKPRHEPPRNLPFYTLRNRSERRCYGCGGFGHFAAACHAQTTRFSKNL